MNQDLVDEIEYMIDLLTKSGFFSQDEILEILEDQFIEYEIDFSEFDISPNDFNNNNFSVLEKTFKKLSEKAKENKNKLQPSGWRAVNTKE